MQKKSLRGRIGDQPNPIDVYVGRRIKVRRLILGLTQEQLGKKLGLTFQQVQKYERGQNRVGCSRLWDLSQVLECPIAFFFEGLDAGTTEQSPRLLNGSSEVKKLHIREENNIPVDYMNEKETLELIRIYYRIPNREFARKMVESLKTLIPSDADISDR